MKRLIARIVTILFFGGGLYGIVASVWFCKTQIFSYSDTRAETKQYYDRCIQPKINERLAALDLAAIPAVEQTNVSKMVSWIVSNDDIARHRTIRGDVVLFSLVISLFSVLFSIILHIWIRVSDLRRQIENKKINS